MQGARPTIGRALRILESEMSFQSVAGQLRPALDAARRARQFGQRPSDYQGHQSRRRRIRARRVGWR
jgi:hypothetical protein